MKRAATALCAALFCLLAPGSASGATCPNEALRIAQGATSLPSCMALEMVSPPKKFSQPAYLPSFSKDGERILLLALTSLGEGTGYQYYGGDLYVATRDPSGWELASTAPLDPALLTASGRRWGSAFSPNLDRWAQLAATQAQFQVGTARLFEGGLDGSFEPLSPLLTPLDDSGTEKTQQAVEDLELSGTSADLNTSVLRVTLGSTHYLLADPYRTDSFVPETGGDRNSYVAFLNGVGGPELQLLARDGDEEVWGGRCGAHVGGSGSTFNQGNITPLQTQGAISAGGERVYFSTRPNQPWDKVDDEGPPCDVDNGLRVLKRVNVAGDVAITEIAPDGGGSAAPGDDLFQAASADGTRVYFLSPRKLTGDDNDANTGPCSGTLTQSKGCDIYLYDEALLPATPLVLLSGGLEEASVLNSTTAISGDGSRAYFVTQGVLTADVNSEGDAATADQPNLYVYEAATDELSFIATLLPNDAAGMWSNTKGQGLGEAMAVPVHGAGPEDGGDGHVLAFASKAAVTEDDEDGGFRDVYRYDAQADTLERISKAPEGGSDNGPFDASVNPAWVKEFGFNGGETTRWASEDGRQVAFATKEALIPADEDEAMNPYLWEEGTLGAVFVPLFDQGDETRPPALAPQGGQIAFSTTRALLPTDEDVVEDVYVARPNGGFPFPVQPTECDPLQEGSCQQLAPAPQGPAAPASASFSGPGNAKQPTRCRKGQVKRRGRCVRKARKGKARRQSAKKRAGRR